MVDAVLLDTVQKSTLLSSQQHHKKRSREGRGRVSAMRADREGGGQGKEKVGARRGDDNG